ncbi:hypothetical protein [Metamycoplasma hyosynoviae]|uniref:hypothetical protein n=1 Tax=Metamycoplasma hyosynoviae TaxID=29559 RepID=UPI0020C87982|nr:hypothetical protein [Metamycoplasma hyosynoviae]UTO26888.1 hypothetical protein NMG94_01420 [Metamycoplasma hyosynoviae]
MAEKKFLLRETIHPQTKQTVYLIYWSWSTSKTGSLAKLTRIIKTICYAKRESPTNYALFLLSK